MVGRWLGRLVKRQWPFMSIDQYHVLKNGYRPTYHFGHYGGTRPKVLSSFLSKFCLHIIEHMPDLDNIFITIKIDLFQIKGILFKKC
jgi:hypothetical protein